MRSFTILFVLFFASCALATTIESPTKEKVFKRGEKITCAGVSDEGGGAVVVNIKKFSAKHKKGLTCGSKAGYLDSGPWTMTVEPPMGGWPIGEMTIEIFSARRSRIEASVKIQVE